MQLKDLVARFDELFNLTYLVINSLKGRAIADYRLVDCERLAHKIFMHAATIRYLYNGSNLYLDQFKEGAHIEDFASVIVLTRATLETYINLFEIFFESKDEDELEYRHATFQIEGFRLREIYIPLQAEPGLIERLEQSSKDIEEMRERVRNTNKYKLKLDHNQRSLSLEGKRFPKRSIVDIAEAAGFQRNFIEQQFAYQSAYTHGDALSISQIAHAHEDAHMRAVFYMNPTVGIVMMVLSELILNFQAKYPEADNICRQHTRPMQLANQLSILASQVGGSVSKATKL